MKTFTALSIFAAILSSSVIASASDQNPKVQQAELAKLQKMMNFKDFVCETKQTSAEPSLKFRLSIIKNKKGLLELSNFSKKDDEQGIGTGDATLDGLSVASFITFTFDHEEGRAVLILDGGNDKYYWGNGKGGETPKTCTQGHLLTYWEPDTSGLPRAEPQPVSCCLN